MSRGQAASAPRTQSRPQQRAELLKAHRDFRRHSHEHISPRQIDRCLDADKRTLRRRQDGRTKPGTLLKHHIPVKTDRWDVQEPGFTEIDLVAHSGHRADGEFVHSLNVTDIHTTWVETRAVLGKGQLRVQAARRHPPRVAVSAARDRFG